MITEIIVPKMGVNMTEAVLSKWLKKEGESVKTGDPVLMIETDKAVLDIEAEGDGVIRQRLFNDGDTVPVLSVVGYIGELSDILPRSEVASPVLDTGREIISNTQKDNSMETGKVKASPAARRLAKEKMIELSEVTATGPKGEVTSDDIERFAAQSPAVWNGTLEPAFVEQLNRDPGSVGGLSSMEKIKLYSENGARIGTGVEIGEGSCIISECLEIGDNSRIGAGVMIKCGKIKMGKMNRIGNRADIRCRELIIGDMLYSADDILIGAGGELDPGSKIHIGDLCFLGKGVVLNPCEEIVLEDEVCLSPWAKIFTHSHWQNLFEGYNVDFARVRIKKGAWLGPNSFVMPGVTVGRGATVSGNSFVAVDVPDSCLVAGVPAKVIKSSEHYPKKLTVEQKDALAKKMMGQLAIILKDKQYSVKRQDADEALVLTAAQNGRKYSIVYGKSISDDTLKSLKPSVEKRTIIITLEAGPIKQNENEVSVFDISKKSVTGIRDIVYDEVRELLRKRGVRFSPILWRYKEGL